MLRRSLRTSRIARFRQQLLSTLGFVSSNTRRDRSNSHFRKFRLEQLEDRRVLATMLAVDNANNLLTFDSATPGTIASSVPITGLAAGSEVVGIDVRPATGQLYALGLVDDGATRTGQIYTVATSGAATAVGIPFSTTLQDSSFYGFDFNPVVDRIRVTNRDGLNIRVNPNTGALAGVDTNLSVNGINDVAYDRNVAGATLTTLYGYNFDTDQIVTIGGVDGSPSPNTGTVTAIGGSGIVAIDRVEMDIEAGAGTARITADGNLFTVNLTTGASTLVGAIGAGGTVFSGLTHAIDVGTIVNNTVVVNGTNGPDTIRVEMTPEGALLVTVNGVPKIYPGFASSPSNTIIAIEAGLGNDSVTVDSTNGAVVRPIQYNGDEGDDRLTLQGGTATSNLYSVGPTPDQGRSDITINGVTQSITFTGLEPVLDLVAGPLTVFGTPADNAINYSVGSVATNGLVTIDNFESIEFSNKTTLTIEAGHGSDTINLNNPNTPTGLIDIVVNGDDDAVGDKLILNQRPGLQDQIRLLPSILGLGGGTLTGGGYNASFNRIELLDVVLAPNASDSFAVDGTTGNDEFFVRSGPLPGEMHISGIMFAAGGGAAFSLPQIHVSGNSSALIGTYNFNGVGGTDRVTFSGTQFNDSMNINVAGPTAGSIDHDVNGIQTNFFGFANMAEVIVDGLDGDDLFRIPTNIAIPFAINGGNPDSGSDVLAITGLGAAITVDYETSLVQATGFSTVTYSGIERLDVLANNNDVTVKGTSGNDTLDVSTSAIAGDGGSILTATFKLVDASPSIGETPVVNTFQVSTNLTVDGQEGNNALIFHGTAGDETLQLSRQTRTLQNGAFQLLTATDTFNSWTVVGHEGDDIFQVTEPAAISDIELNLEGGTGFNSLAFTTASSQNFIPGSGKSGFLQAGVESIGFTDVQVATVTLTGAANTFSINAGTGNNAINVRGVAANQVDLGVDNGTDVSVNGGLTTVNVNANAGNDFISVSPGLFAGTFNIDGGSPTASDTLVVTGTNAAENPVFTPTAIDGGIITGLGPIINITTVEHLIYDGLEGGDNLTIVATANNDTIMVTPGAEVDSGTIAVNTLLPISFEGLASTGRITFSDQGGGADRIVYNGTSGDDNFSANVVTDGRIGFATDSVGVLGGVSHVDMFVPTAGNLIEGLTLNGLDGDDNFVITSSTLFSLGIALIGGNPSSGSDTAIFNGTAGDDSFTLNLNDDGDTLTGVIGGTVVLSNVEDISFSAGAGSDTLTVNSFGNRSELKNVAFFSGNDAGDALVANGTGFADHFVVKPLSPANSEVRANDRGPTLFASLNAANTSTFTINGANGDDVVTVLGTALGESINVTTTTVTVGALKQLTYGQMEAVAVLAAEGNDIITIESNVTPVFVDGGDPIGVVPGDQLVVTGGVSFTAGPENDEGGVVTAAGIVSFDHIESLSIVGIPGCPFLVVGTNGDDDITVIARDASTTVGADGVQDFTVSVNDGINIVLLDQPDLYIDAMAGDDDIVIRTAAPNEAAWDVNVRVAGGSPSIGAPNEADRLVLETPNALNGFDDIVFNPTGNDTGNLVIDKNANGIYDAAATDSLITFGAFVFNCPPALFTYTSTDGGVELIELNGEGAPNIDDNLTINGTALDDTTTINPTGIGTGTFVSGASPLFVFQSFDSITVNPGSGGYDHVIVNGTEAADTVTSNATTITLGGLVTLGAGIDQLTINTFGGNDNIDLDLQLVGLAKFIYAGVGNDTVNLSGVIVDAADPTIFGGDGDDLLIGSPNPDIIFGGAGNDILIGGGGVDHSYGEDGNDIFGNPSLVNDGVADDPGADFNFGGPGFDNFIWEPGDGQDFNNGGEDGADIFRFFGDANANAFILRAGGTPTHFNALIGAVVIDNHGIEDVIVSGLGGADSFVVQDLYTTEVVNVNLNLGAADAAVDAVTVNGRALADNLLISTPAAGSVLIAGLRYNVTVSSAEAADTLAINGNDGDDRFVVGNGANAILALTLNGNDGNDFFDASATTTAGGISFFGQAGNDTIIGGFGDDSMSGGDGEDTFVGGPGNDSIDGGADFDTILVKGTTGNDGIDINQTAATTLVHTVNGNVQTDTLVLNGTTRTLERVLVESGFGDDTIRVNWLDSLGTDADVNSLRVDVDGGWGATSDRLGVVDSGTGDLILYERGTTDDSGKMAVGPGNAEPLIATFINIEYAQPVRGNGGDVVVFKHDPFEFNQTRTLATYLGANDAINVDPNINPGLDPVFGLEGDEDWYRVVAERTGVLDFQVYFRQVPALANGRPGLPNNGNLDIAVTDEAGNVVAGFGTNDANDNERIRIPAVAGETYYLRVFANGTAINTYNITVDNYEPPTPFDLELLDNPVGDPPPANSDTGRSQFDNVTRDNTPTIVFRLDDAIFLNDLPGNNATQTPPDEVIPIPHQAAAGAAGYRVAIFDEGPLPIPGTTAPQTPLGFATFVSPGVYSFTTPVLLDGSHFLTARVQMVDPAGAPNANQTGFGPRSQSLEIIVDTVIPPGFFGQISLADTTQGLAAESDSGVVGQIATFADRITNDTTPEFYGRAEADTIVRLYVESNGVAGLQTSGAAPDLFLGLTTTEPLDGSNQFPGGQWKYTSPLDLNNPAFGFTKDGLRTIYMTAEDVAGNVTADNAADTLNIFLDTAGPQVTNVQITGSPAFNLFGLKPGNALQGPTPAVNSLTVSLRDLPNRSNVDPNFLYEAIVASIASQPGNIVLKGDHSGIIQITSITVVNAPRVNGSPATATIRLDFAEPLPDDRFTLTLLDSIVDPVGNNLDGESNAAEPNGSPTFPSGDGQPKTSFLARFTVDSRPEVGTVSQGLVYVDINGNFVFDPEGQDNDQTNRDFIYQFGTVTDGHFAGNFSLVGNVASGYDKLGVYGFFNGAYSFSIDTNDDGVADFSSVMPAAYQVNGIAVAGNFSNAKSGDEIGLFDGKFWYLDTNGNNVIDIGERFASNANGLPVVGDFNGDGSDDLALYNNDTNTFTFDTNRDGIQDFSWVVADDIQRFLGLRTFTDKPVAGDLNLDGIDDIGLWTKSREGASLDKKGEFFFWVSDRANANPANVFDAYSPRPLGNDLFAQFGSDIALPVFGNFDPPVSAATGTLNAKLTNGVLNADVNKDGSVTPIDALIVINALKRNGSITVGSNAIRLLATNGGFYWDVSGDGTVSPVDILQVINFIKRHSGSGEGESTALSTDAVFAAVDSDLSAGIDSAFADLTWAEDLKKRRA